METAIKTIVVAESGGSGSGSAGGLLGEGNGKISPQGYVWVGRITPVWSRWQISMATDAWMSQLGMRARAAGGSSGYFAEREGHAPESLQCINLELAWTVRGRRSERRPLPDLAVAEP